MRLFVVFARVMWRFWMVGMLQRRPWLFVMIGWVVRLLVVFWSFVMLLRPMLLLPPPVLAVMLVFVAGMFVFLVSAMVRMRRR